MALPLRLWKNVYPRRHDLFLSRNRLQLLSGQIKALAILSKVNTVQHTLAEVDFRKREFRSRVVIGGWGGEQGPGAWGRRTVGKKFMVLNMLISQSHKQGIRHT